MALTLDATLATAQDSQSRHPIVEIISAQKGDDIPFDGTFLTPETFNEFSPSVIAHSSGRLCLAYCYGPDADDDCGIKYVYTDTARTIFTTVTIELYTTSAYVMKSVSICEMTDGNIGIVCLVDDTSQNKYRILRRIVTVTGTAVSNAEIANWSHDTYTSDPWVATIDSDSYLLVYGKAYITANGTNYFIYTRTSVDFLTWGAETLTTIDIDQKAVMSLTIATAECTENEGTYNLIFTGDNTTPATGTYTVVWYIKTLSIDDSDCIEADGTYDLIFTGDNTTPATGTYTITSNVITDVTITDGGTGYAVAPTVATQTGDGSISSTLGKKISSTTITNGGTGYAANPSVATQSGSGSITALISIKRLSNPSIEKITSGDLWLWFDALENTGSHGEELTNIYYSVSTDAGATWANASKFTAYDTFGEVGLHPVAIQKSATSMHAIYTRRVGALHMDDTEPGWPAGDHSYELSWDAINRKLYAVNNHPYSSTLCIVKIDPDTWTCVDYWDSNSTPSIPSIFTADFWHFPITLRTIHQDQYIAIVSNTHRACLLLDGETDTITTLYFDTIAEHSVTQNVAHSLCSASDLYGTVGKEIHSGQVDMDNQRLWLFFESASTLGGTHFGVIIGYIDLSDVGNYSFTEVVHDTGDAIIDGDEMESVRGFFVDVAGSRLIMYGGSTGTVTQSGTLVVWDITSGGMLYHWGGQGEDTDFPYYGLSNICVLGDKIYGGMVSYYSGGGQSAFRGLCEIDLVTQVIKYHRPSYASIDDYFFGPIQYLEDNKIAMTHKTYGVAIFDIVSEVWELYNNTNVPGMTISGDDNWADAQIAYDSINDIIYVGDPGSSAGGDGDGVIAFSRQGYLRQGYYSIGALIGGAWSFNTAAQLVQGYRDFEVVGVPDPSNATSMYCFWTSENTNGEQSIKWDKDGSSLDLSDYLTNDEIVIERQIDGNPATLEFSVSHGHLFDPYNQTSLLSLYLKKGRKLTVRFGEKISGVDYWQAAGTFYVVSGQIPLSRGPYPVMKISAEDQRALWAHSHVYATDIYSNTAVEILTDLMTDIADMSLSEIDTFTIDGDQTIDHQWIETTLDEVLTQVCNRFGYYYRFTVDGKFSVRKITDSATVDHTYIDQKTIIEYSPDDKYSDFTNRVTVQGQERSFTTVTFAEEQIDTLFGTLGWWGCKKEHKVWFSQDHSRRCVKPRLEVIETAMSIPMRLAGHIEESLEECTDADDFKFCTVNVKAPNLIGQMIASAAGYIAATFIPDMLEIYDDMTIPIGRLLEGAAMYQCCMILGSVANYQYAVWARPLGSVRRSVQGVAEDTEHQAEIGVTVEKKFEDALCYSAADCLQVAAFELMVAKMQRKRVTITKIAHLQDEDGDTIRFVHPISGANIDLFVTNLRRKFKKGPDGYFLDEIDGWVVNQ